MLNTILNSLRHDNVGMMLQMHRLSQKSVICKYSKGNMCVLIAAWLNASQRS